jgi:hypothetical protein
MSETEPTGTGVAPSDALADEELTPEPGPGPEEVDDGVDVMDALLSTEPADSAANYPERPEWVSHAVIGVKKAINGIMDSELQSGTTALENFAWAGIGMFMASAEDDEGGNPDEEPDSDGMPEGLHVPDREPER